MEKSKVGTSRKDRDEARESKVQSDLQEETTFFNEQISIQKLQSQVKELEARNKDLERKFSKVSEIKQSHAFTKDEKLNKIIGIAKQALNKK